MKNTLRNHVKNKDLKNAGSSAEYKQLLSIFDSLDEVVYVSDPYTYEILYVNPAVKKMMGNVVGKKCYNAFQKLDSPCPFCTNDRILGAKEGDSYIWESQNRMNHRWYRCIDKMIDWPDGRRVRCEIAIDITERKHIEDKLIKSNKKLKQLALKDPDTDLFNHRYMGEIVESEFYRAKRFFYPLSVIMLDIDFFKSVNDVYGHFFGDFVLRQFAAKLKRAVRKYDTVIRYGAEEFLIIAPMIDRQNALVFGQRLLDEINLYNFGTKKHNVKLRVSLAVATYPEDEIIKGMDLIKLTDQILSKVKESGGNKVFSSADIKRESRIILPQEANTILYLKERINKLTKQANQDLLDEIFALAKTIEVKDHQTGEHVERTVMYAIEVAKALKLSGYEVELIRQASMLHDLGKIGIAEKILFKKGRLTKKEFEEIKRHPQIGVDIIRPVHVLRPIIPYVLHHHEKWNGKGYPYGLRERDIPLGARIVAIADVFQALISDRPYRKAFSEKKAIEIIRQESGGLFDPEIVGIFLEILQNEKEAFPASRSNSK